MIFRHAKDENQGIAGYFWAVIDFPLNLMRDLTIPAGDKEKWDRTKMSFVPIFLPFSMFYLYGFIEDTESPLFSIGLYLAIPGAIIGLFIGFCTKKTDPPAWLLTTSSILCFIMSIGWINLTSGLVVDTIGLGGRIIDIP